MTPPRGLCVDFFESKPSLFLEIISFTAFQYPLGVEDLNYIYSQRMP